MALAVAVVALQLVMEVGVIVFEFTPEKLAHYRRHIEAFNESAEQMDERIKAMANVMQNTIDRYWDLDPVQIVQRIKLRDSFQNSASNVMVCDRRDATQIDLFADDRPEGATPQNTIETKGCAP